MSPMLCRKFTSSTVHSPQIYRTQFRIKLLDITMSKPITGYNVIQFHSPLTAKNRLFNISLNFMTSFQTFRHVASNF